MTDVDARDDEDAELVCIRNALTQLRLEHGDHPCYAVIEDVVDAIEDVVNARTRTISQLRGALRAVHAVAADALL